MTSPETPLQQRTFAKPADAARAKGLQIICETFFGSPGLPRMKVLTGKNDCKTARLRYRAPGPALGEDAGADVAGR